MNRALSTLLLGLSLTVAGCNATQENKDKNAHENVIDKNAITWTPDISEALASAKASGKLLFVECYSPTCPICQSIEPYFKEPEVAEFYNTNFVNYKLDVGIAEQVKFLNDRNIYLPSFPQFLFFDGDGNLVHQGEATANTESILTAAKNALSPDERSTNFKKRFADGDRDFDFLVKYGVFTRLMKDTLENYKVADALFETFPKNQIGSANSWAVTKKTVTSIENGFFKYWINNIPQAASFEKKEGHEGQELNVLGGIVQSSLTPKLGKTYSLQKLKLIKDYIAKVGGGEYADSYVWEYEMLANLREGKKAAALQVGKNMAQKFANNGPSLVYITRVFNDNYPDNSYLPVAQEWLKTAMPLITEQNYLAEFNYEVARIQWKQGDIAAAKKSADDALQVAQKAGVELKKFNDLKNSIK